jgi:hypothetical protein
VKGDLPVSLAKPVLAAPPTHSACQEQQLELAWLTGEGLIEQSRLKTTS